MKSIFSANGFALLVAPLVGAWIEIAVTPTHDQHHSVAPLVGAWIEILFLLNLPRRTPVAPLVGAWIEMPK